MKMIGLVVVGLILCLSAASEAAVEDANSIDELLAQHDYNGSSHAQVLRLYRAIFNRVPDVGGAKYWIDVNNQGYGVLQIAGFMAGSEEWATTYNGTSDERFVEVVYSNVLGRGYDQAGYNYWLDLVKGTNDSGGNKDFAKLKRHAMVFYVTANVEFVAAYPFSPLPTASPAPLDWLDAKSVAETYTWLLLSGDVAGARELEGTAFGADTSTLGSTTWPDWPGWPGDPLRWEDLKRHDGCVEEVKSSLRTAACFQDLLILETWTLYVGLVQHPRYGNWMVTHLDSFNFSGGD